MNQTIFEVLRDDHQKVTRLLQDLKGTSERNRKQTLVSEIREELEVHASAEEQAVYPRLAELSETEALAENAEDEHTEIRDRIEELVACDFDDEDDFAESVDALEEIVAQHVEDEESEIFAEMEKIFDEEELDEIKDEFMRSKRELRKQRAA